MIVLKLGGSVITEKGAPETLDDAALDRAAAAIAGLYPADAREAGRSDAADRADPARLVLVHGGGSFGHPHAEAEGVTRTEGSHDAAGVYGIHAAMGRLNAAVLDRLHDRGVPALPVHPLSAASRDADGSLSLPTAAVEAMLGEGFVPVLHGDVVAHTGRGATVVSGDELVVELARALCARRVGLCSAVPGVLDAGGEVVAHVGSYGEVADALGESDATDVTGGMAGKVRALLDLDAPAFVFGPGGLSAFLEGDSPGTRVG